MKPLPLIFFLSAVVAIGCKPAAEPNAGQPSASTGTTPVAADAGTATTGAPAAEAIEVPAELRTAAYHWFGLSNTKPMKLEVTKPDGQKLTGTQTVSVKSANDGKVVFSIQRDGTLEQELGSDEVEIDKGGIFTVSSTILKSKTKNLEMPARIAPGATWKNASDLETTSGVKMKQNLSYKAARIERVSTAASTDDALLVVGTGTTVIQGAKWSMQTRTWFVKDRGLVKAEMTFTNPKDKSVQKLSIQETK